MNLSFVVYGIPTPQGSMKSFMPKGARFPVLTSDNKKLKPWRQEVAIMALAAMNGQPPIVREAPLEIFVDFFFDRPSSVGKKIVFKVTKPDLDKLLRGILDALTGVCYVDDSQIVRATVSKQFGSPARAEIRVVPAEQRTA